MLRLGSACAATELHEGHWDTDEYRDCGQHGGYRGNRLPVDIRHADPPPSPYSHSIVPGGFEVMSYTTRFTSGTSFTTRREIVASSP